MREKLKYALYRVLFTTLALLPFRVLYCISDGVRMILQHVMKYRRGVIRMNLRNSFPEKTDEELREIEQDFYKQFADNIVETAKLLHISDKQVDRRIKVECGEIVDRLIEEGDRKSTRLNSSHGCSDVPGSLRQLGVCPGSGASFQQAAPMRPGVQATSRQSVRPAHAEGAFAIQPSVTAAGEGVQDHGALAPRQCSVHNRLRCRPPVEQQCVTPCHHFPGTAYPIQSRRRGDREACKCRLSVSRYGEDRTWTLPNDTEAHQAPQP